MLAGLKHLVRDNLQDIVESSYLNCHTHGVHSFMLIDYPGRSIRVFYATPEHTLWKNSDVALFKKSSGATPMSVGFHGHRRNLTLEVISGKLTNISAYENDGSYFNLNEYEYDSKIIDDKMKFVRKRVNVGITVNPPQLLERGQDVFLRSDRLHTVTVDRGATCSWLVYEGAEDPGYNNMCYSNDDLEKASDEGLYIKPTMDEVKKYLAEIGLYSAY